MSKTDAVGAKINAAALLLTAQRFDDCIAAYQAIADQHPEEQGTCLGQIGACYFSKGEFSNAIQHYTAAKKSGAEPGMMDDNIQKAQEALAKSTKGPPLSPPKSPTFRSFGVIAVVLAAGVLVVTMVVGAAVALMFVS